MKKYLYIERDITRQGSRYILNECDSDGMTEDVDSGKIRWDNEKDTKKYDAMYANAEEVYEVDCLASNRGLTQIKYMDKHANQEGETEDEK